MQNADMAAALGVNHRARSTPSPSASAPRSPGLAGGVLAPIIGRGADHRRRLHRQGLHHRHRRRRRDPAGTRRRRRCSARSTSVATFADDPGDRRGRAARRRDRAAAPAAAGHHRPLLPEERCEPQTCRCNVAGLAWLAIARRSSALAAAAVAACRLCSSSSRCSTSTVYVHHGDPGAVSLGSRLGLRRHPLLRPGRVLRPRRLRLCDRRINFGESTVPSLLADRGAGGVRGAARLLHVLWPHQRRLPRRHHADRDADPVQLHQLRRPATHTRSATRGSAASTAFPAIPPLNLPGDPTTQLDAGGHVPCRVGAAAAASTSACAGCWPAASAGSSSRSARTRQRAELLGYDARLYKLASSRSAARIAGLAGVLFANWGAFVSPTCSAWPVGADHHLGHRRRPRHPDRADHRLRR